MSYSGSSSSRQRLRPTSPRLREREERLESLVTLAGRLAHDFNNFLVPVMGYTALIREDLQPDSPLLRYVAAMEKSARKTENAIQDIVLVSRAPRQLRCRKIDFGQLVETELAKWQKALSATARITVKSSLQSCRIDVDEAQWEIALQHLFQNARFALATGGTLTISLLPETLTTNQAAELGLPSTDLCKLVFQDNGFGMSEETVRRAFELFFSTRPRTQALGMGLAVVHSIVRSHRGQIILESAENVGSTVTIWLPMEDPEVNAQSISFPGTPEKQFPEAERAPKILLVADDPFILEVVKGSLERARWAVLWARDGPEGLKLFKRHASEVGLVISDLMMPNMTGVEMMKQMRQLHPPVPLVLITGAEEECLSATLAEIIPPPQLIKKPFRLEGFMDTVENLVG